MIAAVLLAAQACTAYLPPADAGMEWYRNGRLIARDEPVRASARERVYRRVPVSGAPEMRTLSCVTADGRSALRDQVGGSSAITLPLDLRSGASTRLRGATVRRVDAPEDAARGALWFSETRDESRLIGVRRGIGIEEVRTVAARAHADVLRGVVSPRRPPPAEDAGAAVAAVAAGAAEAVRSLQAQIAQLQLSERMLRDSVAAVRSLMRDSLLGVSLASVAATERVAASAARMLADSAARLPSSRAARRAALVWPGAGHKELGASSGSWTVLGAIPVVTGLAAVLLPDRTFAQYDLDPSRVRRLAFAASAASYVAVLLISRGQLDQLLHERELLGATSESFLAGAQVVVGMDGRMTVVYRHPAR